MTIWTCLWRSLSKLVREDTDYVQTAGKMHKTKCFSYCHSTKKLRISSKSRFSLGFYSCWAYLFYVFFIIWIALMQRHFNSFRTKSLPLPFMTQSHLLCREKVRPSTAHCSLQHLLLGAVTPASLKYITSFNPRPVAESEINKSLLTASVGWDVNKPLPFCLILSISFHQHSVLF